MMNRDHAPHPQFSTARTDPDPSSHFPLILLFSVGVDRMST